MITQKIGYQYLMIIISLKNCGGIAIDGSLSIVKENVLKVLWFHSVGFLLPPLIYIYAKTHQTTLIGKKSRLHFRFGG